MKERTLINRYHQTQERPKSPVEQRVKVMDTLDKKMQTVLEREDLSAEERLKLYDQSFTRYLNKGNNKLPNSVQSYKGKVKTHNYINRQISQNPQNCENRNDPD